MIRLDNRLQYRPPSLAEARGERRLLVWGELGQWLVVDAEAAAMLERFGNCRRVRDALNEHARAVGKPSAAVVAEALPIVEELVRRGILGSSPATPSPIAEPLRVSNLTFNITNRCNLRCPWCYNPRSDGSEVPIPELLAWLRAGRQALDAEASLIVLGGEPFLDPSRLVDCVRGAREVLSGEILVSTNGTLAGASGFDGERSLAGASGFDGEPSLAGASGFDGTAKAMAEAGATVQVSLDGATAARHDALRGTGVFRRAVDTASQLVAAGVHTILSMVLVRGSEEELEAYFDLATRIGVQEVRFIPLRRIGQGAAHADQTPDLYRCFQRLLALLGRRPELSRLLARDFFSILMIACRFSRLRDNCGIARRCLFVDADGSLLPCPNHRGDEFRCGHVRTTPLATLLTDSTALKSLRLRYRLEAMAECLRCPFRYWCAGDCRAEALSVGGRPDWPSPYCQALRRILPDMFWLIAEGWQGLGGQDQRVQPWS